MGDVYGARVGWGGGSTFGVRLLIMYPAWRARRKTQDARRKTQDARRMSARSDRSEARGRVQYVPLNDNELERCSRLCLTDTYIAAIVRLFTDQLADIGFHNPASTDPEFKSDRVAGTLIPILKDAERAILAHGFVAWTPVLNADSKELMPAICTPQSHVFSVAVEEGMYLGIVAQRRSDLEAYFGAPTEATLDRTVEFCVLDQPSGRGELTSVLAGITRLAYITHSVEAYDVVGSATECTPPLALGNAAGGMNHHDGALLNTFTGDPSGDEDAQEVQIRRQTQDLHAQTKELMMEDAKNVSTV